MSKRWIKALLYAALTAVLLVVIAVYNNGLHKVDQIDTSYFGAQRFCFFAGAVLLGIGISVRRMYRADAVFLSLLGGGLLAAFLVLFLAFGGLSAPFDEIGYAVANAQMLILDAAMLACFVRCAVLSVGIGDVAPAKRWTVRAVCATLALVIVCFLVMGCGVRFAQYEDDVWISEAYSES